jgi:ABC-2 type transport system permease protein
MNAFAGTGALVRLILRRDRVLMPIWILFLPLLALSITSGTAELYPTDEGRQGYIDSLGSSPLLIAFYGITPAEPSLGALVFWRLGTGMTILALIGLLVAIRHTRVEEEAGRRELIGSTVVGRHANLAAALLAVSGAAAVCGLLVALIMVSQNTPASGSFAMGAAWAGAAILFAAIGTVIAQLTEGAAAARGLGILILGISWLLRGIGDVEQSLSWLSWVSPLGWFYRVDAYAQNRWWVFGLVALAVLGLAYLATVLSARRDLGAGMLPPRLGPASARPSLRSPLALAWRLHRPTMVAWTAGLFVFGVAIGASAQVAVELMEDNETLKEVMQRLGGTATFGDVMLASGFGLLAIFVTGYAISAALRMRTEESALRSEPVLAAGVSRLGWAASHLVFALLGPAVVLAATGIGAGLMRGVDTGDIAREIPRSIAGALVQLPAIWVLVGLTVAAFGLLPRLSPAVGWAALALCLLLGQVGALLQLSQAVLDVSPFTHIPRVPGGEVDFVPLLVLAGIAAALIAVGFAGFRRRDIPVT